MAMDDLDKANTDACRQYQAYYDSALCQHVGFKTPEPTAGQDVNDYRADCMNIFRRAFLPRSHELGRIRYHNLVDSNQMNTFNEFERQNIEACKVEAFNPRYVPPGEFRMIEKRNPYGQVSERVFIGQDSFVKQMNRPGRLVTAWGPRRDSTGRPVTQGPTFLRRAS